MRKVYNDVTFIDEFLTEEFCERHKLYSYGYDPRTGRYVVVDRDWRKVKERLLFSLTNLGQPIVHVVDANYANRGELYLKHRFEGVPLDLEQGPGHAAEPAPPLAAAGAPRDRRRTTRGRLLSFDGKEPKTVRL